jgi:hypothetical protein
LKKTLKGSSETEFDMPHQPVEQLSLGARGSLRVIMLQVISHSLHASAVGLPRQR